MGRRIERFVTLLVGMVLGAGYTQTVWINGSVIGQREDSPSGLTGLKAVAPNVATRSSSKRMTATAAFAPADWVEEVSGWVSPVVWPVRRDPLPCVAPQRLNWEDEFDPMKVGGVKPKSEMGGMYFIKPIKVGGSTLAGVHLRLMHRAAQINQRNHHTSFGGQKSLSEGVCRGNWRHRAAREYGSSLEDPSTPTLLWSVLRDPTARAVSQFFHFGVSREKIEPTDRNFRLALLEGGPFADPRVKRNETSHNSVTMKIIAPEEPHYLTFLDGRRQWPSDVRERIATILPSYDFIAVTERMDESLVVLKHLWHLDWGDLLYLSAKRNGGYDAGGSKNGCTWIVPSFVSEGMAAFFGTEQWLKRIDVDFALYAAVNQSLDLTIEQVVGRERFDQDLRVFRHEHLAAVEADCGPRAIFPCTASGQKVGKERTNCLWADSACAHDCLDEVASRIR